jgi:hypothetical protein
MTRWSDEMDHGKNFDTHPERLAVRRAVDAIRDRREQDERVLNQVLLEMLGREQVKASAVGA